MTPVQQTTLEELLEHLDVLSMANPTQNVLEIITNALQFACPSVYEIKMQNATSHRTWGNCGLPQFTNDEILTALEKYAQRKV